MLIERGRTEFLMDGERIEEVEDFVYPVSTIKTPSSAKREIMSGLAIASRDIHISLKSKLRRATDFTLAIYGCESWALINR